MARLPVKQAADLAETMSKHGLAGSISMGKPMGKMPMDGEPPEPAEPAEDGEMSEMDHCVSEVADAMMGGDKEALVSALHDLVDCIKHEDVAQDMEE